MTDKTERILHADITQENGVFWVKLRNKHKKLPLETVQVEEIANLNELCQLLQAWFKEV